MDSSNLSNAAENYNSKNILPNRAQFLSSYCFYQSWSIPESIIFYMAKNPTSKAFRKLIHACKYFFLKNPLIIIQELYFDPKCKKLIARSNGIPQYIDKSNYTQKFWITDKIDICFFGTPSFPEILSSVIPLFGCVDVKVLHLADQNISFKEFLLLSSNVENFNFRRSTVRNENSSIVPLEKLVAALPKAKKVYLSDLLSVSCITSNTVKVLLKLPYFTKINKFHLTNIPQTFDMDTFFNHFIKENKHANVYLSFRGLLSAAYKNILNAIVNEIAETVNREYKCPFIKFNELVESKQNKIAWLYLNDI